jgi:hypothetical protein
VYPHRESDRHGPRALPLISRVLSAPSTRRLFG